MEHNLKVYIQVFLFLSDILMSNNKTINKEKLDSCKYFVAFGRSAKVSSSAFSFIIHIWQV